MPPQRWKVQKTASSKELAAVEEITKLGADRKTLQGRKNQPV